MVYVARMTDKPVPSRREEYAEATRTALLDAARESFVEGGFQQASVETIARRARVTRGAFYHHFSDKRSLFEALVVTLQVNAAERLVQAAVGEKSPMARLQAGARVFLQVCMEPAYRRLVIQEASAVLGSTRCREIGQTYAFGVLAGALAKLKSAGVIDIENEALAARMLGAMICEAAMMLEGVADPEVVERQAVEIIDRAFASLAPSSPSG